MRVDMPRDMMLEGLVDMPLMAGPSVRSDAQQFHPSGHHYYSYGTFYFVLLFIIIIGSLDPPLYIGIAIGMNISIIGERMA